MKARTAYTLSFAGAVCAHLVVIAVVVATVGGRASSPQPIRSNAQEPIPLRVSFVTRPEPAAPVDPVPSQIRMRPTLSPRPPLGRQPTSQPQKPEVKPAKAQHPQTKAIPSHPSTPQTGPAIAPPPVRSTALAGQVGGVHSAAWEARRLPKTTSTAAGSAEAAIGSPTSEVVRFRSARPTRPIRPVYPLLARRRGWQGLVLLHIRLDSDGSIRYVSVAKSSGYHSLDEAALDAVRRVHFVAAERDGEAVASTLLLPVRFRLADTSG